MIFIDFDDVLFNTREFVVDLNDIYFRNGISKTQIREYDKFVADTANKKGKPYSPKRMITFAKKNEKESRQVLNEVEIFLRDLKKYIFSDSLYFLESFLKKDLWLLSYGNIDFQKQKIYGSGMSKIFSRVTVNSQNKIKFILKKVRDNKFLSGDKIIFIDDNPNNLIGAEKVKNKIITIRIRRPQGSHSRLSCSYADYEAKNLKEAAEIIKKLKAKT